MNAAIRETIGVAETYGLSVERLPGESQYKLLISNKHCQIVRSRAVFTKLGGTLRTFIPLLVPKSAWAEFLILFVTADADAASERFYILPMATLRKRTMLSTSSWVREYANGWHLLSPEVGPSGRKRERDGTLSALSDRCSESQDVRIGLK
jgi:hypothetical protein